MDKASSIKDFGEFQAKVLQFESKVEEFRQPVPTQILCVLLSSIALAANALDKIKKAAFYGKPLDEAELQSAMSDLRMMMHGTRHMVLPTSALGCVPYPIGYDTLDSTRKFHALLGKITETGELAEALVTAISQAKKLDMVNVLEETGGGYWYDAVLFDTSGHGMLDCLQIVDRKLMKRYGDAYNDKGTLNRDTAGERKAMEQQLRNTSGVVNAEPFVPAPFAWAADPVVLTAGDACADFAGEPRPDNQDRSRFNSGGGGEFGGAGASDSWGSSSDGGSSSSGSEGGTPD